MKECLKLIKERRSITFFDPHKEVPEELIKEILEVSATAPSGYNLQPWEVIVVRDREKKKRLKEICYGQQKVEDASANIVLLANTRAGFEHVDRVLQSWEELGYIKPEARESLRLQIISGWQDPQRAFRKAVRDTALFGMTIMITARAYGLETHPMEGYDEQKLKEFLGVEEHKVIPMIIAIGYKDPTKELLPRAYRFSFEEFGKFL
ncbi:MAG: nitroreductase family protein [Aquificaceae bacterium]|nr:nitroreductase family protein [Aquificaceae bacterium]MCS7196514.1 nitroreductase family protein [Aquificaceae bacterium]MCX7989523.1 nitroreductase family protein [Aquificaceae bacterium]MDW8294495.1 nitroreductase family protein [Aquificaceae bacterium]